MLLAALACAALGSAASEAPEPVTTTAEDAARVTALALPSSSYKVFARGQLRFEHFNAFVGGYVAATRLARLRAGVAGRIARPELAYKLQAELAGSSASLRDAHVDWTPRKWFGVMAGQMKVPFLRQTLVSSFDQAFVERSEPVLRFGLGRNVGVRVHGRFLRERATFDLGAFNGIGSKPFAANAFGSLVAGRTTVELFGGTPLRESCSADDRPLSAEIGVSGYVQLVGDFATKGLWFSKIDEGAIATELALRFRNAWLTFEYFDVGDAIWRGSLPLDVYSSTNSVVQLGFAPWPGVFEVAIRRSDSRAPLRGSTWGSLDTREGGFAVTYWPGGGDVKLQLDATRIDDTYWSVDCWYNADGSVSCGRIPAYTHADRIRVQLQVSY